MIDPNAQETSATSAGVPADNHSYGYNMLNQLTQTDGSTAYGYDQANNPTSLANGTTQAFDPANQLCWSATTAGSGCSTPPTAATTYSYDNRGDLTTITPWSGSATTLGYDQARRLTGYGTGNTYTYNGDGLRMTKTVNSRTENYTYDQGDHILVDGTTNYIYGPDGLPLEQINGSTVDWYHHDRLRSTRALTDNGGNVVGTFSYDPYGNTTGSAGTTTTPFGYAGGYRDTESGLTYLINRYYNPTTGQFLTRDPLETITGSAYGYVDNNPINGTDRLGLSKCGQLSLGGFIDCAATTAHDPVGTFKKGWDSMSTSGKIVDATLPITMPLTALGVVSGGAAAGGATVFNLTAGGTTALAFGTGAAATATDTLECRLLHSTAACVGAGVAAGALGLSGAGALAGGAETMPGSVLGGAGLGLGGVGALWDIATALRDLLRNTADSGGIGVRGRFCGQSGLWQ